jgi:glycosyltransferase involved in cell wall biosynthesis
MVTIGEKARNTKSSYRDPGTLNGALNLISQRTEGRAVYLVQVGSTRGRTSNYRNIITRNYGYLQDERQIAQVYQAADVLLYASRADTFPTVILESLACGTPVIATSVGGIPEQINHGSTGFLVPKGDYADMANRALQVLLDDQLRGQLSENAVRDVGMRFNLHHQARKYLDLYAEILSH